LYDSDSGRKENSSMEAYEPNDKPQERSENIMEKKKMNTVRGAETAKTKVAPVYEPPKITTYTEEQILEQIGPAQACSPNVTPGTGAF
jgi:hypothetical protein